MAHSTPARDNSFLLVEGLFYLKTLLFGAVLFQVANSNPVIRSLFVIGYATCMVSLVYVVFLIVFRSRYQPAGAEQRESV